jgi:ribose/xylose/arabinose/galactoside ABC-type transport system permease subunit
VDAKARRQRKVVLFRWRAQLTATGRIVSALVSDEGRETQQRRSPVAFLSRALRRLLISDYFVLHLTIAYFLVVAFFFPALMEPRNLSNQLSNVWPLAAVAIGQTFVIIIAGIDLSLGATMGFASVAGAIAITTAADKLLLGGSPLWGTLLSEQGGLLAGHPLGIAVAVAVMLAVGLLIGFINGFFIARFKLPAFMMTLVTLMFFSSLAIWITQSQNIVNLPDAFTQLGAGDLVSVYFGEKLAPEIKRRDILPFVTYPMMITVALAVVAHLVLSRTVFGRQVYAIGTNAKAAAISGVPVRRVVVAVFMIAGFCAAVAAILYSARLEGGRPTIGGGSALLDIIGATVIGGTSLSGGKGKIVWTMIGVLFFVLLSNTLNYMRLSAFHIDVVKGAIILAAALLDVLRTRLTGQGR